MKFPANTNNLRWANIGLLFILLLFHNDSVAQKYTVADSAKALQLIKSAFDSSQLNPERSITLAKVGVTISEQIGFIKGIEKGTRTIGFAYQRSGDVKNAFKYYSDALEISRKYNLRKDEALTLYHLGALYSEIGANDKAFEYHESSLNIETELNDSFAIADGYNSLAIDLTGQNLPAKAINFFLQSIALYHILQDSSSEARSMGYIAVDYVDLKQYALALQYFKRSLDIRKEPETYSNLGYYYGKLDNPDSALYYNKIALDLFTIDSDRLDIGKMLDNIGQMEIRKGLYMPAKEHLTHSLSIVTALADIEEIGNVENNLATLYAKQNDYKDAYEHHITASLYKDSLLNIGKARKIEELNTRYEVKELEDSNIKLQKENDLQKLKIQRKNTMIISAISLLAAILVIGILLFRQNKLHTNQQRMELEQKQLRAQMNPHFIFNCLNSIQHFIVANDVRNANKYLSGFALLMRQTLENSKDGVITLRKEIAYLENYLVLERMRFEDKFIYEIVCAADINRDTIEIPSMIIQPFIENAIRHGLCYLENRQGKLRIHFYVKNNHLYCEVDDNGIGREQSRKIKMVSDQLHESQGMELTRQRLALVSKTSGNEYKIEIRDKKSMAQESEGTTIIIKFPLEA